MIHYNKTNFYFKVKFKYRNFLKNDADKYEIKRR